MKIIIILLLLYFLFQNLGNLWLWLLIIGVGVFFVIMIKREIKDKKRKDKEFLDDVETDKISYKRAYLNGLEIHHIKYVTDDSKLKEMIVSLEKFANDYEETYRDKNGNIRYNYEGFRLILEKFELAVPFWDYTDKSNTSSNIHHLNQDLNWIHEVCQKDFLNLTKDDINNILKWRGIGFTNQVNTSNRGGTKFYFVKKKDKVKKMSRKNYLNTKVLDENFEDFVDAFGNLVSFK